MKPRRRKPPPGRGISRRKEAKIRITSGHAAQRLRELRRLTGMSKVDILELAIEMMPLPDESSVVGRADRRP